MHSASALIFRAKAARPRRRQTEESRGQLSFVRSHCPDQRSENEAHRLAGFDFARSPPPCLVPALRWTLRDTRRKGRAADAERNAGGALPPVRWLQLQAEERAVVMTFVVTFGRSSPSRLTGFASGECAPRALAAFVFGCTLLPYSAAMALTAEGGGGQGQRSTPRRSRLKRAFGFVLTLFKLARPARLASRFAVLPTGLTQHILCGRGQTVSQWRQPQCA